MILAFGALAGSASGSSAKTGLAVHQLRVDMTEWAVIPSDGVVAAGPLRVKVANVGQLRHELDIVPTESWGQKLRIRNGRAVGENAAAPIVVAPGQTRSARMTSPPGTTSSWTTSAAITRPAARSRSSSPDRGA